MSKEPQPCQMEVIVFLEENAVETTVCIRCGTNKRDRLIWECPTLFFGPGDVVFRVARFFGIPHCRGCRKCQRWLNLNWYRVIHAGIFRS